MVRAADIRRMVCGHRIGIIMCIEVWVLRRINRNLNRFLRCWKVFYRSVCRIMRCYMPMRFVAIREAILMSHLPN